MERRGLAEVGGATAGSTALAAVAVYLLVGGINWPLVVGAGMMAGIAAAANYQARTTHSDAVADEAPSDESVTAGSAEGSEAMDHVVQGPRTTDDAGPRPETTDDAAPGPETTEGPASDPETGDDEWGEETR